MARFEWPGKVHTFVHRPRLNDGTNAVGPPELATVTLTDFIVSGEGCDCCADQVFVSNWTPEDYTSDLRQAIALIDQIWEGTIQQVSDMAVCREKLVEALAEAEKEGAGE